MLYSMYLGDVWLITHYNKYYMYMLICFESLK